jgi:hypothetical protein
MFGRSGHELRQFENFVFRFVWNFCFMKFSVPNLSMKISILESICAEYEDEKSITLTRIGRMHKLHLTLDSLVSISFNDPQFCFVGFFWQGYSLKK